MLCYDRRITIRGQGDDLVTDVISCLSENRIRVTDFCTVLPNLEDVFLKLTVTRFANRLDHDTAWTLAADLD